MPQYTNPAEFLLELVNIDFTSNNNLASTKLDRLISSWEASDEHAGVLTELSSLKSSSSSAEIDGQDPRGFGMKSLIPLTLVHRNFVKGYRDIIAYGIRIAMYMGLAIMMGTVWLRLAPHQRNIQSFVNAIVS